MERPIPSSSNFNQTCFGITCRWLCKALSGFYCFVIQFCPTFKGGNIPFLCIFVRSLLYIPLNPSNFNTSPSAINFLFRWRYQFSRFFFQTGIAHLPEAYFSNQIIQTFFVASAAFVGVFQYTLV